jgi:pimeloyl-ACP methyl ester carboxylesterase
MTPSLNTIVFITGTFISNNCWDEWISYFENEGYKCIAPPWSHKDAPAEELRNRAPNDAIALNTITSLTDHFAAIINALPEKPILIGHSVGGLVVQLLLQRELGHAGVAIHSFPPRGVNRFRLSFVKPVWETMVLFTSRHQTYLMPFRKWKKVIANRLTCEQQKELYYKYAIPESKQIMRDIFRCLTKIDFKKPHPPLLLTSGSNDKLIPAALNYSNYKKYTAPNSVTDYKNFKGHTHLVFGHAAWKREADFILYWLHELVEFN